MKKMLALALAILMVFSLSVPALATNSQNPIDVTITNGNEGSTYEAYKVMSLIRSGENYNYTVEEDFKETLLALSGVTTVGKTDAAVNNAIVAWVAAQQNTLARELAEDLMDAIEDTPADFTAIDSTENTFADLAQGYYLIVEVVSNDKGEVRSLIMLDTATADADEDYEINVEAKNSAVGITKTVNGEEYAVADYNEDVTFVITTNLPANLDQFSSVTFKITDTMDSSLVYNATVGLTVTVGGAQLTADQYSFNNFVIDISEYVTANKANLSNAAVVVTYKAALDATAERTVAQNNAVFATYSYDYRNPSDTNDTVTADVDVYTYGLDVIKYTDVAGGTENDYDEGTDTLLAGAEFELTNSEGKYAEVAAATTEGEYNFVGWVDASSTATKMTTPASGKIIVNGLKDGEYTLTETVAPQGYNLLDESITVTVTDGAADGTSDASDIPVVEVLNKSGSVLPSTGGMGTTIFYTLGGLMVAGALVLLVTKKRVEDAEA